MGVSFDPGRVRRKGQSALDTSFIGQAPLETIKTIRRDQIDPWTSPDGQGQPFRLYSTEKLEELAQNIRDNGILNPCIVRPKDGRYQLLAGHNRVAAAGLAGLEAVPCIVKDVDDDTATLYMIDSNLYQREQILPSERAAAYALKLEIYRRRGRRTDLSGEDHTAAAQRVADEAGDSARSVQRYARLTKLTPELLELVDEGKIPVTVGSEVAGMRQEDQSCLYEAMQDTGREKLSMAQVQEIRAEATVEELAPETVMLILESGKKTRSASKQMLTFSIPADQLTPLECKRLEALLKEDPMLQQLLLEAAMKYLETGKV